MATLTYAAPRTARPTRLPRAAAPDAPVATSALRLTRRGRVLLVLALMMVVFVAFSTLRVATSAGTSPTGPATTTVTVHPGETLWQIARRVAPGDDTRDTVLRIRELNALATSVVQAGQRLVVPR